MAPPAPLGGSKRDARLAYWKARYEAPAADLTPAEDAKLWEAARSVPSSSGGGQEGQDFLILILFSK